MKWAKIFVVCLTILNFAPGIVLAAARAEVKSVLESRFKVSRFDLLGNLKESGSVFVVRREGLKAGRPGSLSRPNIVANREVVSVGGGSVPLGGGVDGMLKPGDRLYLHDIKTGDDFFELTLFTVRTYVVTGSGTRGPTPLQASVRFRYEGELDAVTTRQVVEDVGAWFGFEGGLLPAAGTDTVREPSATRTVRSGQTEAEVTAILGQPETRILLGAKTVFVYREIRIVFMDGKVADAY